MGIQPTRSNYFLYPQIVEAKDKPLDFKILIVGYWYILIETRLSYWWLDYVGLGLDNGFLFLKPV